MSAIDMTELNKGRAPSLVEDEEITGKALEAVDEFYNKFKTQREDFEEIWKVADYMVKVAQNRSLNNTEMSRGVNPSWDSADDTRAETGSTLFFQQWRALASQLASVALSSDVPFKYSPIGNDSVFASSEEADSQADQRNALTKWTLKQDNFALKIIEFASEIQKYGNIPVLWYQHQKIAQRVVREPVYQVMDGGDPESPELVIVSENETDEEYLVENWPSWKMYAPDSLFADIWIPKINDQDCVILPSLKSRNQMLDMVKQGIWNEEQYLKIDESYVWDGVENHQLKKDSMENLGQTSPDASATDLFLTWDVYLRAPIDGTEWKEKEILNIDIYCMTVVGNTIKNGIPVVFERNRDPDDEIPITMIHAMPGDPDVLYHMCNAQVVRSNYSVECTLKNQMIDNSSQINHPAMKEVEGEVRGTDRAVGPNKVFKVDHDTSLTEFVTRDLGSSNIQLLEFIKEDTKSALSTSGNMLGEAYGGRTSALEAGNAYKNSIQPHMISVRYILEQFLQVYARKMNSYWEKYAYPGQVLSISDENKIYNVYPAGLYGEFDIQVDVIDEYEQDVVKNQRLFEVIQLAVSSPEIAKNLDLAELMTEYLKKAKFDYAKIIQRPFDYDAKEVARKENSRIIYLGESVEVQPSENMTIHLAEHEGERLRWNGKEEEFPGLAVLDQHIAATKLALRNGSSGNSGSPQGASGAETAGDVAQEQLGAAMGGMGGM